jgi:sugar phosphate isomerase/epimerase
MNHVQPTGALLAVSSWSWHDAYFAGAWSLLDLPAAAAAIGITAIEANDFMLPPPRLSRVRRPLLSLLPGASPDLWRYSKATLRHLLAKAKEYRIVILAWTINSDFSVPAYQWPLQRLYLVRGVAAARLLQAPMLRIILGGSPGTPRTRDGAIVRRLAEFFVESQRRCPGLTIVLENHWGISSDIDRHLAIFDQVYAQLPTSQQSLFGCCFDPAHRAIHYHLKTNAFNEAGDEKTLPHHRLFELLYRSGYRGMITIEFAGDGPAGVGVKRSAELFLKHGAYLWDKG